MSRSHPTVPAPRILDWAAPLTAACLAAACIAGCAGSGGAGASGAGGAASGNASTAGRLRVAIVRTAGSEIAGFTMDDFEKASWTRTSEGGAQLDILLSPAATQRLREASGKAKAKGTELYLAAIWDGTRIEPRTRLRGEIGSITIRNPQVPDPAGWAAEVTSSINANRR